jgi:sugar phosphate isomerase/epimerase
VLELPPREPDAGEVLRGVRGAARTDLLGDIAAQPDSRDAEAAVGRYREAMALADALGMRPLVAHCHLGLGRLSRRTGNPGAGGDHVASAIAKFRELDMRFWLERAEADAA